MRQVCQQETHDIQVVVLEEPEISVLASQLMREVRELGDLEEILLLDFALIKALLDNSACPQKYTRLLLLVKIFNKAGLEKGVRVLHLIAELIP